MEVHLECRSECKLRANFQSGSCHRKECTHLCIKTGISYTSNKADILFSVEEQSPYLGNPWKVLYIVSNFETAIMVLKALDKNMIIKGYYVLGWWQNGELVKRFSLEDMEEVVK